MKIKLLFKNYSDDRDSEDGDIKVLSNINFSKGQGTLNLLADDEIEVNADIISGPGGLLIRAPGGIKGRGSISINPLKKEFVENENNPDKLSNFLLIDQRDDSQFAGEIIGNKSSKIYKNGLGELSLSNKLKDFKGPVIYGSNAGLIISLQAQLEEQLGGTEFIPPKIVIKTQSVSAVSSPARGGGGSASGGGSSIAMSSSSSSSSGGGGSSSSAGGGSSSESSSSSTTSSESNSSSSNESSSSDSSSETSSSSEESSSSESSSEESSSSESSSEESSSEESSSDEESEKSDKGNSAKSNKKANSVDRKKRPEIKISASQTLAGISNIIELKRKSIIDNLNKSQLGASDRTINSLNLGSSFESKSKSTIDLRQAIINAREEIQTRDYISRLIDNKNLVAFLGNSNLQSSDFIFENKKYNPAIMDIRFTKAKGKTINKNADAFLDLTVISADGNVSGKRVELVTKKFAKNLRNLYSQLSRQEDLKVENESSPSRLLYEIIFKSVEETLNKEKITTLLISADRGLQAVPFAALHDGKKYFGEKYAFSITPSLSLTNLDISNNKDKKILAIGASQFKELAPLPLVNQELNNISNPINKDIFVNKEFTPETFFEKAIQEKYSKIHIATHA